MSAPHHFVEFDWKGFGIFIKVILVVLITGLVSKYAFLTYSLPTTASENISFEYSEDTSESALQKTKIALGHINSTINYLTEQPLSIKESAEPLSVPGYNNRISYVQAKTYIVGDIETGKIYAEFEADKKRPIASISKLFTAVTALEVLDESSDVTITSRAIGTYGQSDKLTKGQVFTRNDILYPLLLPSGNDAATAIEDHLGSRVFMRQLNKRMKTLGLKNTNLADPSGLSARNISTARDVFMLTQHIYTEKPYIFENYSTILEKTVTSTGVARTQTFKNNHPFRYTSSFAGGKNGYTEEALKTLTTVFEFTHRGEERAIGIVVLGTDDHASDTIQLLDWFKRRY